MKTLTLSAKGEIIKQLNDGRSVSSLSREYGVAKSTICGIRKNQQKILKALSNTYVGISKRRRMKRAENPKMETALYRWFLKQRSKNLPISGAMLKEKAKQLHETFEENTTFASSQGWLQNFKKRYGIRHLKISGEKLSSNVVAVDPFKKILKQKIDELGISRDQIYNADETGLFWKLLPDKTFVASDEKIAPGRKTEKARVTFVACTNASGRHKLKPFVIGTAKNPRSFRNYVLPVDYDHSKNAWMTTEIFKNWFHKSFVPQVRKFLKQKHLDEKAILLIDNAPSHPSEDQLKSDDGKIITLFFPPNVTPLLQPMDQNVIRLTKLHYRSSLLSTIIRNDSDDVKGLIKNLTLKDAILNLLNAWEKVSMETIVKCWKPVLEFDEPDEDDIPLSTLRERYHPREINSVVQQTLGMLHMIAPNVNYTATEVLDWNEDLQADTQDNDFEQISSEEDNVVTETPVIIPSHSEACKAFDTCLIWAERNIHNINDILVLKRLQEAAILRSTQYKTKQTKLTSFFDTV